MRILLDESLPRKLGFALAGHFVRTVVQMGWSGLSNGRLLAAAAPHFDVLVSGDQNMQYQQNEANLPLLVITLEAASNRLDDLLPLVPALLALLANPAGKRFYRSNEHFRANQRD